jgi:hypothetical protein
VRGAVDQVQADQRRDNVANTGDEADQTVEAEADVRAGDDKARVEQVGDEIELRQLLVDRQGTGRDDLNAWR